MHKNTGYSLLIDLFEMLKVFPGVPYPMTSFAAESFSILKNDHITTILTFP
jgi:hypothetical protein